MASIPTQDEVLTATRKSQEAMIAAVKNWLETVRTATPKVASVYAPLTDRLPKLPLVSMPFADKLPTPQDAVASAYNMAEQLLASQRKFAEDLLKAMTPLMPGRGRTAAKGSGSSEPKVPGHRVWQEAVTVSEPKPTALSEPKAPARPAAKSTTAKSTAAKSAAAKSAGGASAAKSGAGASAAKSGAGASAAKSGAGASAAGTRTTAGRTPKGTDAG